MYVFRERSYHPTSSLQVTRLEEVLQYYPASRPRVSRHVSSRHLTLHVSAVFHVSATSDSSPSKPMALNVSLLGLLMALSSAYGQHSGPSSGGGVVVTTTLPAACSATPLCLFGVGGGLHAAAAAEAILHGSNYSNHSSSALSQAGDSWRCAAPMALHAGASATLEPSDVLSAASIFGGASLVGDEGAAGAAAAADVVVRLTSTTQFNSIGTLIVSPPLPHTHSGASAFRLSLELLAGRGTSGEGLSISLASNAEDVMHADERGLPSGLVVSFSSATERLHVHFRGAPLLEARLDGVHPSACDGYNCAHCSSQDACDGLSACAWNPWQRLCRFDSAAAGSSRFRHVFRSARYVSVTMIVVDEQLSLWHDGFEFVSRLPVPGWHKLASTSPWKVVLGARTSLHVDDHWVRRVRMEHGAVVGEATVTAAVGGDDAACTATYGYYAVPIISKLGIVQGPVAGGTRVRVYGDGFHRNGALAAACRFGAASVPAARSNMTIPDASSDMTEVTPAYLECYSPNASATGSVRVEVSLNGGGDFTSSAPAAPLDFTYTDPRIERLEPSDTSAATDGPLIVLVGSGLRGGDAYRCGFGVAGTVAAYLDDAGGFVYCRAPSLPVGNATEGTEGFGFSSIGERRGSGLGATLTLPVEVSLNGLDYTDSNCTFTYHPPPLLHALSPSIGPDAGGTRVVLSGAFAHHQGWRCRFGGAIVIATPLNRSGDAAAASGGGGALLCEAPSALSARALDLPPTLSSNHTFDPAEPVSSWRRGGSMTPQLTAPPSSHPALFFHPALAYPISPLALSPSPHAHRPTTSPSACSLHQSTRSTAALSSQTRSLHSPSTRPPTPAQSSSRLRLATPPPSPTPSPPLPPLSTWPLAASAVRKV